MNNKKTARKRRTQNLSVVPVTSRERTGTTTRQMNLRAAMKAEQLRELKKIARATERCKRLDAALAALGTLKKGD